MAFAIEQRLFKGVLEDYVVQTGGSNKPDDIINGGYGTEVGYQTIFLPNHLAIEGTFNCDDWTYITAPNKQITASSPNTVWTSGRLVNGVATGGSSFVFDSSFPIQNQQFAANNANLQFYGVKMTGNQAGSNLRMEFGTLNAASYLKIRTYRLSYITLGWGGISFADITYDYMKFLRFGGTELSTLTSLSHLSSTENNLFNQIYNGVIPVSNYLPLGNGTTQFLHQVGSDRRFILTDPTLDVDSITIQDNGEVVQINQTLDISLSQVSGSKIDNVDLKFHTQDNTHTFSAEEETTDAQGKASANIENVWLGFGQTVNGYLTPTNVTKRTDFAMSVVDLVLDPKTENYTAAQGSITTSVPVVTDSKLTETDAATIAAYTDLGAEQSQRFYDLAKLDWVNGWTPTRVLPVSKEGTTIITDKKVAVDGLAAASYDYDGTTITVKSDAYNQGISSSQVIDLVNVSDIDNAKLTETNLKSEITIIVGLEIGKLNLDYLATSKVDFINCKITELVNSTTNDTTVDVSFLNTTLPTLSTTGSNGFNVVIQSTVSLNGLTGNESVILVDQNGDVVDFEENASTYSTTTPIGATGSWKIVVDQKGYYKNEFTFAIDGSSYNFNVSLTQMTNPNGSLMYQGTSNAFITVEANGDGSRMNARIGNGVVTAQAIVDASEDFLLTQVGMQYQANGGGIIEIALLPTGTYVFLKDNVRVVRDSASDSNATLEAYATSSDGSVLDDVNGEVRFITLTRAQQLTEYGGVIAIDEVNGTDSNIYPYGTPLFPCRTIDNAKALSVSYGIETLNIRDAFTFAPTDTLTGWRIKGNFGLINFNGATLAGNRYQDLIVYGDTNNDNLGESIYENCRVVGPLQEFATFRRVMFTGNEFTATGNCILDNCSTAEFSNRDVFNTGGNNMILTKYNGHVLLKGVTQGDVRVYGTYNVEIDNTCTGGVIDLLGHYSLTDNSNGSTVSDRSGEEDLVLAIQNAVERGGGVLDLVKTKVDTLSNLSASDVYSYFTASSRQDAFKADISNLPANVRAAFDASEFKDKNTEAEFHAWLNSFANKNDFMADVGSVASKVDLTVVNEGVKKASLLIPHTTNL